MSHEIDPTGGPPVTPAESPEHQGRSLTEKQILEMCISVVRALVRRGASREQAEDLAQESVVETALRVADLSREPLRSPLAYAHTVARNALFDQQRRTKEVPTEDGLDRPGLWSVPYTDLDLSLERAQTLAEVIKFCREHLTPRQFEALDLVHAQDLTKEQAAEIMDVEVDTIRSHLHDCVRKLREHRPELLKRLGL
ncbi:RNA polymerase sigma factor [Kitasatospora sp. NPDC058115]|uniref:RNA polymerase sigma factor n=1 Tax=Kitasatospora sp. NPDC058115 TaxID=3346347 RepID=UPI0036DB146B